MHAAQPDHDPPERPLRDAGIETIEWLMLGVVMVVAIVAISVLFDDLITDVFDRFRTELGL